jgi:hypothetical protein
MQPPVSLAAQSGLRATAKHAIGLGAPASDEAMRLSRERWFAFVDGAGFDCSCVGGVDRFIGVAYDPEVKSGFAEFALT